LISAHRVLPNVGALHNNPSPNIRCRIRRDLPPITAWALAILGSLSAIIASCSSRPTFADRKRILFSRIGRRPFSDSVFSIRLDGRDLKPVLLGKPARSYMFASAHSLSGPMLVTVHESSAGTEEGNVEDHLYLFNPSPKEARTRDSAAFRRVSQVNDQVAGENERPFLLSEEIRLRNHT
jgi:hypothetical protein